MELTTKKPKIYVDIIIPQMHIDGDFELNARLLVINLKGNGQIHSNVTNAKCDAIIHGQIVKKKTGKFLQLVKVDVDLEMEDFNIQIDNLFGAEPTLSEASNRIIRENKDEFEKTLIPLVARSVGNVVLDIGNKILSSATFDEFFPQ